MHKSLKKAGIEEKNFHTGEVILNYVVGPPNGIPLVFIPGQSATWEEYTLLLPKLSERFQVFAISLRGHGESSWTPGQYTFNQLGQDITTFLKNVVGKPAVVAGNSLGGVLTAWLAANSPEWVRSIVLEDPPLFRCEWPAIKGTAVYDNFMGLSRMAIAGGGGYAKLFARISRPSKDVSKVLDLKLPPKPVMKLLTWMMAVHQVLSPGNPVDLKIAPLPARILIKGITQFDGNVARAFVDGTVGKDFDHATTLAKITQPILFLHANWFMREGRLVGALDDNDVERVRSLVKGPWKYVRMNCGHAIPLEAPTKEAEEILSWFDESSKAFSFAEQSPA